LQNKKNSSSFSNATDFCYELVELISLVRSANLLLYNSVFLVHETMSSFFDRIFS